MICMKRPTRWILGFSCLLVLGYLALVWLKYFPAPAEFEQLHEGMTLHEVDDYLGDRGYDIAFELRKGHFEVSQGRFCVPTNKHDKALIKRYVDDLIGEQVIDGWERGDVAIIAVYSEDGKLLQKDYYQVKDRPSWRSLLDLVWR